MPSDRPFSMAKDLPMVPDTVHFAADRTAAFAAQSLSMEPWEKWIPRAVPPFSNMLIEWRPIDMIEAMAQRADAAFIKADFANVTELPNQVIIPAKIEKTPDIDDLFKVEGMLVFNNTIWFCVSGTNQKNAKRGCFVLPFEIRIGDQRDPNDPDQKKFEELVWGQNYAKVFGSYPNVRIARGGLSARAGGQGLIATLTSNNRTGPDVDIDVVPDVVVVEFAGIVRFGMAMLALINAERHTEIVIAESTKTFRGGNFRRLPEVRLVVIRPDTVKRAYTGQEEESCEIRRREHGVRRHLRRYRSGKIVWVREHRRGDASIGKVDQRYIVEMDPNKELT